MVQTSVMRAGLLGIAILSIGVCFSIPSFASAAEGITVQTLQVIPPKGTGCPALTVSSVRPYVYDNELHSFDVTIADPSYVAVLGSIGNTGIPFNHMTRRVEGGQLRIHVDVQSTPIYGSLPISLTLLSAKPGQPVCASLISFSVLGGATNGTSTGGTDDIQTPASGGSTSSGGANAGGSGQGSTEETPAPLPTATNATGSAATSSAAALVCSVSGAFQLWFVLIVLLVVVSVIVALRKEPLTVRHSALPGAIIGAALILLLAFWYFVPSCRSSGWVPVILILVAAIALVYAYFDRTSQTTILLLGEKKDK